MEKISPADLIPMDFFIGSEPLSIDLVYANARHPRNIFRQAIYHPKARLWAHKDLATIAIAVARKLNNDFGYSLEIQDCLRPCDAQEKLEKTEIVKQNPDWLTEPNRMLSPPGKGGHPYGMAIDVCILDQKENKIDMGTPFDDMSDKSHRDYSDFPDAVVQNRKILENSFRESAKILNLPILPLPNEWWDFRFPKEYTDQFIPLHDRDLPPQMQMTGIIANNIPDFNQEHFDKLAEDILYKVDEAF